MWASISVRVQSKDNGGKYKVERQTKLAQLFPATTANVSFLGHKNINQKKLAIEKLVFTSIL